MTWPSPAFPYFPAAHQDLEIVVAADQWGEWLKAAEGLETAFHLHQTKHAVSRYGPRQAAHLERPEVAQLEHHAQQPARSRTDDHAVRRRRSPATVTRGSPPRRSRCAPAPRLRP